MDHIIEGVVRFQFAEVPDELMTEIASLRHSVWNNLVFHSTRNSPEDWTDQLDSESEHFVIFDGASVIAAARMSIHNKPEQIPDFEAIVSDIPDWVPKFPLASINRLVVSERYRGRGAAKALDRARMKSAQISGAKRVVGLASQWRVSQLAALRFSELGEVAPSSHKYDELPLYLMQRNLT